jgi:hypothetical protein
MAAVAGKTASVAIPPRQGILGYLEQEVESNSRLYPQQFQTAEIPMTEERKHAILSAATLLSARRLIERDANKPNMAKGCFVDKAIDDAAFILERIDKKWPASSESQNLKTQSA